MKEDKKIFWRTAIASLWWYVAVMVILFGIAMACLFLGGCSEPPGGRTEYVMENVLDGGPCQEVPHTSFQQNDSALVVKFNDGPGVFGTIAVVVTYRVEFDTTRVCYLRRHDNDMGQEIIPFGLGYVEQVKVYH